MNETEEIAVKVENLTKSFKIPLEGSSGLKQKIINRVKGKKGFRIFTPLNDISFEVKKGEFFGIVGRNGSGKSTLLKSIASIYTPSSGGVVVNGKLVPFIELGVGFNPELTGRENVFLNGALLGFSHKEMEAMYEDIVNFAEIGDFMEEKLKNYSSGMQVRLAFSIAIKAEGDILLLDEVLAVGDEAFQRKCFSYFDKLKNEKKTVILVTHDMGSVMRFCDRALIIKEGNLEKIGKPRDITDIYNTQNDENYNLSHDKLNTVRLATDPDHLIFSVTNTDKKTSTHFSENEEMQVHLRWGFDNVHHVGIAILDSQGRDVYSTNTFMEGRDKLVNKSVLYTVKLNLAPGEYHIRSVLFGNHDKTIIHKIQEPKVITVSPGHGNNRPYLGVTRLDHSWEDSK